MPRGWWHVAYPMDEPCLHLAVTIKNLHGISFLHWLANEMKSSVTARSEFPMIATSEERQTWSKAVVEDLTAFCQIK
jgi:ribosomal protein L16 Arg81 hydroxylase